MANAGQIADLRVGVMRLSRRLRAERPDDALTPSQVAVLGTLVRVGSATPSELARLERIQPPSMTRIIDSLINEELVAKQPHPQDGRQVLITLTDKANARIARSRERKDAWLNQALEQLNEHEKQTLLQAAPLLNRIATG